MSFLEALQERRLIRIVASATAVAWGILQVVDQLASRGVVPEVLYYVALVWSVAGVLLSALLGWYHGKKGRQQVTRPEVAVLGLLGVSTLIATAVFVSNTEGQEPGPLVAAAEPRLSPSSVAVKYFGDASGDGSLSYLADGLTESLIYELSSVEQLNVLSQNASLRYRENPIADDSLASVLGVGTLVTGQVAPAGAGLRIEVGLVDGNTGESLGERTFETDTRDIVELRQTAADQVSMFLRERVGAEIHLRGLGQETSAPAAWDNVLRAEAALKAFETALAAGDVSALLVAFNRADSLLAHAEADDPMWPRPPTQRAYLATRMAQLTQDEPLEAAESIARGLEHVERALSTDSTWAAALEERGALRYLRWRMGLERDPVAAPQLLTSAESDLERAVALDPTRARAYNLLSIIASQAPDPVRAKLMARRAFEEDAYVTAAEEIINRLFRTSYDLEDFADAVFYCAEGARRFPEHFYFMECELWLRAAGALDPDVDRAWQLVDRAVDARPPSGRERNQSMNRVVAGGVIARAGLADSARAVLLSARVGGRVDPSRELMGHEAVFRLQLGDRDEALSLLESYLTASPEHREGWRWTTHWWWRDLQDDPEFRRLIGVSQ